MFLYYDDRGTIRVACESKIITNHLSCVEVDLPMGADVVGKKIARGGRGGDGGLRVAVLANFGDACGIATYTKYLLDALGPRLGALRVFAEDTGAAPVPGYDVEFCWKRGLPMRDAVRRVLDWGPDAVLIQHEFGIFPKAGPWLQVLQMLQDTPYAVTLHSVYEHLDKAVCTSEMSQIVVHSESGEACLRRLGNTSGVTVIPHGCVTYPDAAENWNLYQTPHALVQFGFGFSYKGVDVALEAVAALKSAQPVKYGDVFFTYLCSESPHVRNINNAYYRSLLAKVEELGLQENVAILRGFRTEETLCHYLRTNRLAIFPYQTDPNNVVYGASGAVRLAMANRVPVIASASRMFDDIEGVIPRPGNAASLAEAIDSVFSDEGRRQKLVAAADAYVWSNSWHQTALRYEELLTNLVSRRDADAVHVS